VAFRHLAALSDRARAIVLANQAAVAAFLAARADLACAPPCSTLAFPRLEGVDDSAPFVERLFFATGTALAPGRFFGAPAHFRIAFGGAPWSVAAGLASIASHLNARTP